MPTIGIDEITKEISDIAEFCSCYYSKDSGVEMSERLTNLNIYLARTSVLQSEAQELLDHSIATETEKLITMNLPPSIITSLAKGKSAAYNKLWKLCERINRTITHQIEAVRTQLSYLKSSN